MQSSFKFGGQPVTVQTAVHPTLDLLAVEINSPLVRSSDPDRPSACFGFLTVPRK